MRSITLLSLLIFSAFINNFCSQANKQKSNNTDFQKYIESLPTVKLPIKINCDSNLNPTNTSVPDSIIKKYSESDYIPYVFGKFALTQNYVAIIYIAVANEYVPILKITDIYGNTSDMLTLLKNCGGNDICYEANSWTEISTDLKITIKDTIRTCALDTLDNVIPASEKIESETREFFINNKGKLIAQ